MTRGAGLGKSNSAFAVLAALPVLALSASFILPYAAAAAKGIGSFAAAVSDPGIIRVLGFTAGQAAASTLAALAVGLPGSWLIGSGKFRGARLVRAIASVPFAMPPILVVLGFVLFFGNNGWANRAAMAAFGLREPPLRILYRPSAIILAHAFYNFPIVLRLVGDAIARARSAYAPAAASLGASGAKTFRTVLLPIAAPSIASASLLVFLYCFTSFAVVLVLGGGPGATTLPVEIYRAARISLDHEKAGALALIETGIAALAYLAYSKTERISRRSSGEASQDGGTRNDAARVDGAETPRTALISLLYFAFATVLVAGPLAAVAAESFLSRATRGAAAALSLRWWLSLSESALPALMRSLVLAAAAATISVALASMASLAAWGLRRDDRSSRGEVGAPLVERFLAALCMAPIASSGIVLGLGWIAFYGAGRARSFWAVALAHAVSALPFAYRSVSEGIRSLPSRTAAASAVLGASPISTAFRVALPAAGRRIGSAWAFAAAVSLGELNAVLMLGLENFETLPMLMYRAAGAYRFGAACAAGVLLAASCAAAFALSERGN